MKWFFLKFLEQAKAGEIVWNITVDIRVITMITVISPLVFYRNNHNTSAW